MENRDTPRWKTIAEILASAVLSALLGYVIKSSPIIIIIETIATLILLVLVIPRYPERSRIIVVILVVFIMGTCLSYLAKNYWSTVEQFLSIESWITPGATRVSSNSNGTDTNSDLTATPAPTITITSTLTIIPYTTALVPAGTFEMGGDLYGDEKPTHHVTLSAYNIDEYEVTNLLYKACFDAGGCKKEPTSFGSHTRSDYYTNPDYQNYPVVFVDWGMASDYCIWRHGQLPTEAQWEYAARGADSRLYPWIGSIADCSLANLENCHNDTTQVGSYEDVVSAFGVYDMAGNVAEWVADWYDPNYYGSLDAAGPDSLGPSSSPTQERVYRGGSWASPPYFIRAASRSHTFSPNSTSAIGFRCAYPYESH